MNGLEKLYLGDFNYMSQTHDLEGNTIITLSKDGEDKTYRFKVKDLYGEQEELLEHEEIKPQPAPWIAKRVKEAKKHAKASST